VIGRFYSNDPVGFSNIHNFNRFAYANNNPFKYVDPDGRSALDAFIKSLTGGEDANGSNGRSPGDSISGNDALTGVSNEVIGDINVHVAK
jgi:hypothetical protein